MKTNRKVSDYIRKATDEQMEIMEILRTLIHQTIAGVSEEIKWGFPVFCNTKDFAYLRFSKKHITLGFYKIEKINDPENVLEGSGNTLKHIKIRTKEEINEQLLKEWLVSVAF